MFVVAEGSRSYLSGDEVKHHYFQHNKLKPEVTPLQMIWQLCTNPRKFIRDAFGWEQMYHPHLYFLRKKLFILYLMWVDFRTRPMKTFVRNVLHFIRVRFNPSAANEWPVEVRQTTGGLTKVRAEVRPQYWSLRKVVDQMKKEPTYKQAVSSDRTKMSMEPLRAGR